MGAGVFGTTCAAELAIRGYNVTLFEQKNKILTEATAINQYRVHRGYHYPRSKRTAIECKKSAEKFVKYFRSAILPVEIEHYYAISSTKSLTSSRQYLDFLDNLNLEYEIVDSLPGTALTVKVVEHLYDPQKIKSIIEDRLFGLGIEIKLNSQIQPNDIDEDTFTVAATYSSVNDWAKNPQPVQFELCEKPVLKLPQQYKNKSIVIMDGPFMCIDPFGDTEYHVMGNVVHAIHHSNIGYKPEFPDEYKELLNNGIIENPPITKIEEFLESARIYLPGVEKSDFIGSMFTIRAVKPNREHDDARPTIINWENEKTATIFSGKICTCINTAGIISQDIAQKLDILS